MINDICDHHQENNMKSNMKLEEIE